MSVWTSQRGWVDWRPPAAGRWEFDLGSRARFEFDPRLALATLGLCVLLAVQGVLVSKSYLWAAPVPCLLFIALATEIPIVPFTGALMTVRVLVDDVASSNSRYSSSLSFTALIAGLFILLAAGLIIRRRRGLGVAVLACLWIGTWTSLAVLDHGASAVTVREGIRELSIVAVGFLVYNSRGALDLRTVVRIVQVAGFIAALLALFQLGTHSGTTVGGFVRSYGTFAHPNDAAVYFAVATMASLWLYLDQSRRRLDLALLVLFAAALISTFSLAGCLALVVMVAAFALLRSGSLRLRIGVGAAVVLFVAAFALSPLGSERLESESGGGGKAAAGTASRDESSSLDWRFRKWAKLVPEWEKAPVLGLGLGTRVATQEATGRGESATNLPHSEYVRYLVETGAAGALILLAALWALIRRLRRFSREGEGGNAAAFGLALVIGLLVNAAAANTLLYTPAAYAAAMIVAAILAAAPARAGARALPLPR